MALIECSECGRQISDRAPACPGCGAPVAKASMPPAGPAAPIVAGRIDAPTKASFGWLRLAVITLVVFVGYIFFRQSSNTPSGDAVVGVRSILREPRKVVSERISLKEGQAMMYSFTLPSR